MSFANVGAYACQNLQTDLVTYFGKNAPQFRTYGSTSTIKWLLSPQNTANFKRLDVTSIPGKKRPVAFRIVDPFCFDVARVERLCSATPGTINQTPQEIVYDLTEDAYRVIGDDDLPRRLKIDLEDLERFCTVDDMSWITDQINRYLIRFEESLDANVLALLVGFAGTNKAGEAITNLPLWVTNNLSGTSQLNPETQFALNQTMQDIMVDTQWAAIGGSIINKINQFTKWMGLDAAGVDMSKQPANNPYTFYDRNAEAVLGTTDFLQIAPGVAQLVYWNRFGPGSSLRRQVTDLYSKGTITLPTTGLDVDWEWKFDYDCSIWYFEPSLHLDVAVVPPGGCGTPDVNGLIRIHDCSGIPVIPVCPEEPIA
jgi:hypothetical protein